MALRHLALASVLALTAACSSSDDTVSPFAGTNPGGASASGGASGSGGGASGSDASPAAGGTAKDASGEAAADATIDAAPAVDATSDVEVTGDADADAASCDIGCTGYSPSGWCAAPTVEWVCGGAGYDHQRMLDAGCQELATGAIRYCCPAAFLPSCI